MTSLHYRMVWLILGGFAFTLLQAYRLNFGWW